MRQCLVLCLVFCGWLPGYDVSGQLYSFVNYTSEQGLAHNEVRDIIQASDGKLWAATSGGVSSFNGRNFFNFTTRDGLAADETIVLFEDSEGRIWVGTRDNGFSIISNNQVYTPEPVPGLEAMSVGAFAEGVDSTVYIFYDLGICTYKHDHFEVLDDEIDLYPSDAEFINDSTIILSSLRHRVFQMHLRPYSIGLMPGMPEWVNSICYTVHKDAKGDIWVGSYGVIYQWSGDTLLAEYVPDYKNIEQTRIYDIREDTHGNFLLGTEGNGLINFEKSTGTFQFFNQLNGLPSRYIYSVTRDTEMNDWLATYDRGIARFRDRAFRLYNTTHGMPSDLVNDVLVWEGKWFVGTDQGLAIIQDGEVAATMFENIKILDLSLHQDNYLLLCTSAGVFSLNSGLDVVKIDKGYYYTSLGENDRLILVEDNKIEIVGPTGRITLDDERTRCIEKIGEHYLLAKHRGLFVFDGQNIDTIAGLSPKQHKSFHSIVPLSPNSVLAGSKTSIYQLILHNGIFNIHQYSMPPNGALDQLTAMAVHDGNIWVGANHAIARIDLDVLLERDSFDVTIYNRSHGYSGSDIAQDGLRVTDRGIVLAASNSGLVVFEEAAYKEAQVPPRLDLRQLRVLSEPVPDSLFRMENALTLSYRQNQLTFDMEAVTFTNPQNGRYQYSLSKHLDEVSWSLPTSQTQVVFQELLPGNYIFQFKADNGNDVWQEVPYSLSFTIEAPFWRAWWFWFTVLMSAAGVIIAWMIWRNRNAQLAHERFAQGLINAQEEERTRVARDLHDGVGQKLSLLARTVKGKGDREVEDLADSVLSELRSASRNLYPAYLQQLGLSAALQGMINEVDAHSEVLVAHEIANIDDCLRKDQSLHLYRICQELLGNMIKHSGATEVNISISIEGQLLVLLTEDNGIGFDTEEVSSSLGLRTIRERLRILNGSFRVESDHGHGTITRVEIPIQTSKPAN